MKLLRTEYVMLFILGITIYTVFELYKFATTGILIGGYTLYMVRCVLVFILLVTLQVRETIEERERV